MKLAYTPVSVQLLVMSVMATTALFSGLAQTAESEDRILKILTWPDYIDPDLVKAFENQYDAVVEFTYFETDEHRDEIMIEQEGRGYDLMLVSAFSLPGYVRQGWLKQVEQDRLRNRPSISATCKNIDEELSGYYVPYFWGTVGIAYRSDLVSEPPASWMDLFRPAEAHRGHIMMIGDSTDLLGMAVIAQGNRLTSESTKVWEDAARLALEQKPYVKHYGYTSLTETAEIVAGNEIHMAQVYSGDALTLKDHNENIEYVQPQEGAAMWVDLWAVAASSANDALSHGFLDVVSDPKRAAANAEYIYLATCNDDARALLPVEHLEEEVIYPPPEVVEKLQFYPEYGARVLAKINSFYSQVVDGE